MAANDEMLTLWLAKRLSQGQGNAAQEILVEDVAERVGEGASLAEAAEAVNRHEPRAGDFGVEVAGSLVAMAVLEGLKTFCGAYIEELEKKAGKSLADASIDFIKSKFKADVGAGGKAAMEARVSDAISAAGKRLEIGPADLAPTLKAVAPAIDSSVA